VVACFSRLYRDSFPGLKMPCLYLLFLHKNSHMFSQGQIYFAILFIIVFSIAIGYTYRKDLKLHKKYYSGSLWMLLAFIGFIAFISAFKYIFG
jgi:4-hydroxybenzoate polyprenyltransferase